MGEVIRCECGTAMERVAQNVQRCPRCRTELRSPDGPLATADGTSGFAMSEPPKVVRNPLVEQHRSAERVNRMLRGLVSNILRSREILKDKLSPEEHEQIGLTAERGTRALTDGDFTERETCLRELEAAAGVIGRAMQRV